MARDKWIVKRAMRALRWPKAWAMRPAASGERTATEREPFGRLYEEFAGPIYGYCLDRVGDAASAEDLTAQVFVQALAAGPRYGDPALRSWLFAIAHNLIANHWRGRRDEAALIDAIDLADPALSPEASAIAHDDERRLRAAMANLPPEQRQVVSLRLAGLTGPEIAEVMGRSHAAVKMLQLRAVHRLRDLLSPDSMEHDDGQ